MEYFNNYVSNTLGGSSNQYYFSTNGEISTGRVYYKIFKGGEFEYSLLFSNIIDSTFSDGAYSHKNLICDSWKIHSLKVGRCVNCKADAAVEPQNFTSILFDGKLSKEVAPGEFFTTDSFTFSANSGEYLCVEISFEGNMVPSHAELQLASFVYKNNVWSASKLLPVPGMIGCKRDVCARIGFFGDSITQGIGATFNSYRHWNAITADMLGDKYAFWNIGIGFGRANDAASDGAWLYKAKQNDYVVVCFGVNDILQGFTEEQLKYDLTEIVNKLNAAQVKIILQTIPPFDYDPEKTIIWQNVNNYIENVLAKSAFGYFDNRNILSLSESEPHKAKYGCHPDDVGCRKWAEALQEYIKKTIFA